MESFWWRRPCRTISDKNRNCSKRKKNCRTLSVSSMSFTSSAMIWIALLLSTAHLTMANASGFFELEVVALENPEGRLASGQCCGAEETGSSGTCQRECATHFRLCLKEYQSNVTVSSPCTYGNSSSPVLAGNSFTFVEPDKSNARLVIPFSFRWPRSFTLMLEAIDYNNSTRQSGDGASRREIERAVYSGILEPSADWHSLTHEGSQDRDLRLTYRVRVQCEPNYYNATCTKFCRPRNDMFGHYECDRNGDKTCMPGWTGATCETAVCKPGCHPINGQCEQPGECRCRWGWKGEFCDQCVPYPGCKHGYCNGNPWQCICETNWGGILCDQDLNYCGTREPCQNGGTCENTKPDEYLCKCPDGFSGTNCEVVDNVCATAPCQHGGTCTVATNGTSFNCTCPPGWTGDTCQINVDECQSSPCLNGATCVDLENGYRCQCADGWQGDTCHQDVDECSMAELCRNALSCENTPGNYTCRCVEGFHGRQCQYNVNDCDGHQCLNGATCIDLIGQYHCACRPGFNGPRCEINIDECSSQPCANGGECVDLVDGFKCICPLGYTGAQCQQTDTDLCHPNPCANGSPCFNTLGPLGGPDYYCLCPSHWQGKNCSRYRQPLAPPPPPSTQPNPQTESGSCWTPNGAGHCVHGRCVASEDGSAFSCQCDPGYSGHFCTDNVNDCADSPCRNGGTCIDGIDSFHCVCPKGYEGLTCDHNVDDCASNPCRHNGTCVDMVADFVCRCVDGWKGRTCSNRNQHCQNGENPCLNGATCVDDSDPEAGFTCRCTSGWRGSVCHLAEHMPCDANPCRNGATCLNTGQSFTCVCKEGFEGQHCQMEQRQTAASTTSSSTSCQWSGRLYPDNSSWDDGCNKCQCRAGLAVCTRVWCGPANCLEDPVHKVDKPCGPSELCLSAQSGCLRPPCPAYGQCRPLKPGRLLPVPATTASCWPNLTGNRLAPTCARLTLVLDRYRAQPGFSVQSLCGHLRKLAAAQSHLWDNFADQQQQLERPSLVILCDLKDNLDDVVQVTISMSETSFELGGSRATAAARVLGNVLSAYYKEGSSMGAVVDVKVETPYADVMESSDTSSQNHPSSDSSGSNYVVAIVCAILAGLVVVAGLLLLLLWRLRKRPAHSPSHSVNSSMDRSIEKSNNLQNEENLRLQQRRMKTLNVAELVDHPAKGSGVALSKKLSKVVEDVAVVSQEDSSSDDYSPVGRRDAIESSPIYKAPISVDVRNNIHLAARAGQIMDKELSLKVVVV
ncbi:protein jagged-1-like isoform X1 [Daphnia carinata]|uniref:protein jagged-1-like isoform X1 n=1 Tax=Daphnia carinata TaxID=120202 RepID=UPI002868FE5E|nr:protein jagged-1-like isoform X1 [Daphnia carinata]